MQKIRIGTRKSKLALWQAEYVAEKLQAGGLATELVTMETKGDKVQEVSIAKIGSKGVFTEELEQLLATGEIHLAVHSAKDMQSRLPEGFELIAFTEREQVHDVIVSDKAIDLADNDLILGTSSTRRVATLKHFYPHIRTVDIRGNLQTRLEKMRGGLCDGVVLAYAGVHRMGYDPLIQKHLTTNEFIPAVGQGSVTIEVHKSLDVGLLERIRQLINHPATEQLLLAERAYLAAMNGGCSIPVFGLAHAHEKGISISGGIVSLDGKERIVRVAESDSPEHAGKQLAKEVLAAGGDRILKEIRESQGLR